jgi:hypothetical protein
LRGAPRLHQLRAKRTIRRMHLYDVVLFLHILTLLAGIGLGTTLHHAEWSTRSATTVGELRTMTRVFRRGNLFPIVIVLLFGEGAWLLHLSKKHDETFHFSDAWVWTAIVALGILMISGGAILGRESAKYAKLLAATPDGPLTPEVRAATFTTKTWATSHMNTFLVIAVVFNMVVKPASDAGAIVVLVIGIAVGVLVGIVGARGRPVATTT